MRVCLFLSLMLSTGLVGCASTRGPAPDPGMNWFANEVGGEGLKLAYGPPNSDDVPVMLSCRPRSGRVRISASAPQAGAPSLELVSKGVRSSTRASLVNDDLGPRLEAEAPVQLAVFKAFAESGTLTVTAAGGTIPTHASDSAAVRRFFDGCKP